MIEDGFSYPLEGNEAVKNLAIGGGLTFLGGLLFLPILPVYGYNLACIRTSVQGYDQPPLFQDWETLVVDGVKTFAIVLAYNLVPLALMGVFFLVVLGTGTATESGSLVAGMSLVFLLVIGLLSLAVSYVLPAAVSNFAVEGNVGAAFDTGTISTVITHGAYVKAFLVVAVVLVLANVIFTLLIFTIVGALAVPWLTFFLYMAFARIFADAYVEATGAGPGGEASRQAAA